jgi:2-polyprenyl-3-methyl-5-hydroxy-6-metoxy-1,4-benzoquinol methylase
MPALFLMTPSNSIAVNLVRRPARAASFIVRSVWAVIVLLFVCLLWLALFFLFLPFLVLSELFGLKKKFQAADRLDQEQAVSLASGAGSAEVAQLRAVESRSTDRFIFDRRRDISKLFGCNTRNVQYRWSVFGRRLADLKTEFREPKAIDFGAGSLRDSYELSRLGFSVVSVDLDESLLQRYSEFYDWKELPRAPQLFARPLDDLRRAAGPDSFHLAIAFDVIEHLEDPAAYVGKIRSLLRPQGLFFTIVPNRRAVFERYFKHSAAKMRRKGIAWIPGVPHLQFKTPAEWEEFFADNGYQVLEHKMAIGPLVNDLWHGLLGLPLTVFVDPVLQTAAYKFRFKYSSKLLEAFYPAWLMERVNVWDAVLKKWLSPRFGWNLIVLQKEAAAS